MFSFAYAQTTVEYYYGLDCPHCIKVAESGVLERVNQTVPVTKYETWYNAQNADRFLEVTKKYNVPKSEMGVPFLLIKCDDKVTYLVGDVPIIQNAENYATTCNFEPVSTDGSSNFVWIGVVIVVLVGIGAWLMKKK